MTRDQRCNSPYMAILASILQELKQALQCASNGAGAIERCGSSKWTYLQLAAIHPSHSISHSHRFSHLVDALECNSHVMSLVLIQNVVSGDTKCWAWGA
jgi:hypothetical protein